jgi:hypothetical protein
VSIVEFSKAESIRELFAEQPALAPQKMSPECNSQSLFASNYCGAQNAILRSDGVAVSSTSLPEYFELKDFDQWPVVLAVRSI